LRHNQTLTSTSTENTARTIAEALTADRAKQTYYIGNDARLYCLLKKLLGERLRNWFTLRTIGLVK
jgi:hypothetical protein